MDNHLFVILNQYLKKNNIIIDSNELKLQILSHPSYPSLHSVTGVLEHFNIENAALKLPVNNTTLGQIPKSIFTIVNIDGSEEYVVAMKKENGIEVLLPNNKKKRFTNDEFLKVWSGVVVAIDDENKEDIAVFDSQKKTTQLLTVLTIAVVILAIGFFFYEHPFFLQSFHFITTLIGVIVSVLIVKQTLGHKSMAVENFCNMSKKTSCNAVLNSNRAYVFLGLKLPDLCIIYFTGGLLSWFFIPDLSQQSIILLVVSILSLPIVIYFVYYQYKVIKSWCPLCLMIGGVLLVQGTLILVSFDSALEISYNITNSYLFLLSILLAATLWLYIKPLLKKEQDLEQETVKHFKFKRNFSLFNALYSKSEVVNTKINGSEISFGNLNAPIQVVLITNPLCHYCKEAHTDIENLLKKHPDSINVTIRFNVSVGSIADMSYKIAAVALKAYETNAEQCKVALHEIYSEGVNRKEWLDKWEDDIVYEDYEAILREQQSWSHRHNINFTPAMLVNQRLYPKAYNRADLNYFIDDLVESKMIEADKYKAEAF